MTARVSCCSFRKRLCDDEWVSRLPFPLPFPFLFSFSFPFPSSPFFSLCFTFSLSPSLSFLCANFQMFMILFKTWVVIFM